MICLKVWSILDWKQDLLFVEGNLSNSSDSIIEAVGEETLDLEVNESNSIAVGVSDGINNVNADDCIDVDGSEVKHSIDYQLYDSNKKKKRLEKSEIK